ncbi:MAG TPA: DUF1236 domain-containing protein [Xanthobacteraceae bacterium]|nr:DUF1236 domain-containing protein [Xanthobacteraceae bacterium]
MSSKNTMFLATLVLFAMPAAASAAATASAVTALNLRSGPGPQYSVVGAINQNGQVTINGCLQGSLWCEVSYAGKQGWAYSQYLTMNLSGRSLIVSQNLANIPVITQAPATTTVETVGAAPIVAGTAVQTVIPAPAPATTVETVGVASPAPVVAGTLVEPTPAAPLAIMPAPTVGSYVTTHPLDPVYLNGEVVVGAGLPENVTLAPVPGYDYDYAYVNSVPVLVEPSTRRIAYIYR